ncbi:MAG: sulfotransferase [Phycisphaeraceae bacterium]|nr:sulfotransferase [Phycisphaeraceae bacterium]
MPPVNPKPRRPIIAFPYPHFMAFAPLDVWLRVLLFPFAWCPPRYWLRLAWVLFTSSIGTVLTLPERLVLGPVLRLRARRRGYRLDHAPGVVVVLGYFRSGTTHLHYLLSCDPRFRTPAWCETLAPHGFAASWGFLRLFLIPWIGSKRPQDDMDLGPSWPAEDDFAQNNGAAASSLAWRFVVPAKHAHYSRFHFLEGLTPREMKRWRMMQFAFSWKVSKLAGTRLILLKSPSHVARVRELLETYGPERVKFVHISRDASAVIESNVAMFRRMSVYGLQDRLPDEVVRQRITDELIRSERNYLRDVPAIPKGHSTELRYEDLVADPIGQLRRVYADLGLEFSPAFERNVLRYLHEIKEYRAAHGGSKGAAVDRSGQSEEQRKALDELASRFGHDRPAVEPRTLPPRDEAPRGRERRGMAVAALAAPLAMLVWLTLVYLTCKRFNAAIWPVGIVIGLSAIWAARVGTRRLGIFAAVLTVLVQLGAALPISVLSDYIHRDYYWPEGRLLPLSKWEWYHILMNMREGLVVTHNLFWGFMGAATAYRFASRKYTRPPGTW